MLSEEVRKESPFRLKVKGDFEDALRCYAHEFAAAQRIGDEFVTGLLFKQMFDICLLQFLKDKREFENKRQLLAETKSKLTSLLAQQEVYEEKPLNKLFNECGRQLVPRGRGRSSFSVDVRLTLLGRSNQRSEQ